MTWYVGDLARKDKLFVDGFGFSRFAMRAAPQLEQDEQQVMYELGACRFICAASRAAHSRPGRYLSNHPEGIGRVTLEVEDLTHTERELARRGGTFVSDGRATNQDWLELATPIDDLTFCFVQRGAPATHLPLSEPSHSGLSCFDASLARAPARFDHVTINTGTILPLSLWLRHLLGLEPCWQIEFHTSDLAVEARGSAREQNLEASQGSGLKSLALWDPASQIRFALNEPRRPNFFASQIELFRRDHRGSGVQHVAIHVSNIAEVVAGLRARGVRFAATPEQYYQALPARLAGLGIGDIDESLEKLRELGILVDGSGRGRYLLQIFMEDDAAFLGGANRSPFFLEFIERKGCSEFGAGNFRALFESIESAQAPRAFAP
jgi:4-hydroxyphenylpyruvate dioxygenase